MHKKQVEAREIISHERNFTLTLISAKHREGSVEVLNLWGKQKRNSKKNKVTFHLATAVVGRRMDLLLITSLIGRFERHSFQQPSRAVILTVKATVCTLNHARLVATERQQHRLDS